MGGVCACGGAYMRCVFVYVVSMCDVCVSLCCNIGVCPWFVCDRVCLHICVCMWECVHVMDM